MTANDFRRLALSMPEAEEGAHMNHPDFRVSGKIFATLAPGEEYGVVLLSPEEQAVFIQADTRGFQPVKGGWGKRGSTQVNLKDVKFPILRRAMKTAWQKRAAKK